MINDLIVKMTVFWDVAMMQSPDDGGSKHLCTTA
jgi:hypothetical protein